MGKRLDVMRGFEAFNLFGNTVNRTPTLGRALKRAFNVQVGAVFTGPFIIAL